MKRPICMLPRESTVLRARATRCRSVQEVEATIQDLVDTWPTVSAHGIAAPQIGVSKRLFIYLRHEPEEDEAPTVLLNPRVIKTSGELKDYDGCLSVPGIYGQTRRAAKIDIQAMDLTGSTLRLRFEGFTARIIQHEMDHLDGVLFIDRIDSVDDLYCFEDGPAESSDDPDGADEQARRTVPLTDRQRTFIESVRRPLPGLALRW